MFHIVGFLEADADVVKLWKVAVKATVPTMAQAIVQYAIFVVPSST